GRVAGSCTVAPVGGLRRGESGHVGELGILVGAAYRGRGVGTALLRHALDGAVGRFEQVRLMVFATNDRAKRLYLREGFVPCGRFPRAVKRDGRYGDLDAMVLDLADRRPEGGPPAKG
ncbi:GCN5-related N-acetyltransferase domain protein, partial [mine drainage metagenome]